MSNGDFTTSSGQIIIFHQSRFPCYKGISLTKPPFGGNRSCEVAIICPEIQAPYLTCSMRLTSFALASTTRVAFVDLAPEMENTEVKGKAMNIKKHSFQPGCSLESFGYLRQCFGYSSWGFVYKNDLRASKQDQKRFRILRGVYQYIYDISYRS